MDQARTHLVAVSEKTAAKGLDVDPINGQITELTDALKRSRTHIHSFSRNTFQQAVLPGEAAIKQADLLVESARREYKFRQTGLAVSIGAIGLLMILIYLKLRQLEK